MFVVCIRIDVRLTLDLQTVSEGDAFIFFSEEDVVVHGVNRC